MDKRDRYKRTGFSKLVDRQEDFVKERKELKLAQLERLRQLAFGEENSGSEKEIETSISSTQKEEKCEADAKRRRNKESMLLP